MKKFFWLVLSAVFLLTSCSMHEEIDLSMEGKGFYQLTVDMSPMLELMKGMSGTSALPDSIAKEKKDTSFSLASIIDSSGGTFTQEEKAYFYKGTMHVKLDMESNKMELVSRFPVKNTADLQKLFNVLSKVDSLNKIKKEQVSETEPGQMPNLLNPGEGLANMGGLPVKTDSYIFTDTSIERKAQSKEQLLSEFGEQGQGAAMFMSQVNYTTTFKVARPIKKLEGKNVKLGADKKSVFFSASLQDMLDDPEAGTFRIIY